MKNSMRNKRLALFSALALAVAPTAAGAAHKAANHFYDYAKVTDVEPVYETLVKNIPVEQCWNERVPVRAHDRHYRGRNHSATPTLIGALIGGALGNELGHHKRNKQVGVVVGSIIGGSIGHDIAHQRHRDAYDERYREATVDYQTVERCSVDYEQVNEQQLVGYEVTYRYRGNRYTTFMDEKPADKLRLSVNVKPVDF